MITASVVWIVFSEELSRVPLVQWLPQAPTSSRRRQGKAFLASGPGFAYNYEGSSCTGVTMETLCSGYPWILFQASLAVSGACLQRGGFRDSKLQSLQG